MRDGPRLCAFKQLPLLFRGLLSARGFSDFTKQRVVVIARFVVRIDRFRVDRIQRRAASESFHQIGIGDKGTSKCRSVAFSALNSLLPAFLRQSFVENIRAIEDAPHVTPDALIATIERLARKDERDVACVQLLGDIAEQRADSSRASNTSSTSDSDAHRPDWRATR